MIAVIDYKTANLGSVINMFRRIGSRAYVAEKPKDLEKATRILLPGIGHFDVCARNLRTIGFADAIEEYVLHKKVPLLGICVGAQLLTRGSDEGDEPGLGWIAGFTQRFSRDAAPGLKIPHMGWNRVDVKLDHALFQGFEEPPKFYFVHSYHMICELPQNVLATTDHGVEFASAIVDEHIAGVQFHPEKSHVYGMQLLRNFADSAEA